MLRLLLGKDWTANRDVILDRISRDVKNGQGNRILMVPELISHETERRLCAAAGDTASRYAEVLSFTRLARRVSDEMGSAALECMDNGGRRPDALRQPEGLCRRGNKTGVSDGLD